MFTDSINRLKWWYCKKVRTKVLLAVSFNNLLLEFRQYESGSFKGIVKWAEPCKCGIHLVSRILWHKRINPSLKWRFSYLIHTDDFSPWFFLTSLHCAIPLKAAILIGKNLWRRVLEANKKQVSLKSYFLKIKIDSIKQILKNKEVTQTRKINMLTRITDWKIPCVYIHVY